MPPLNSSFTLYHQSKLIALAKISYVNEYLTDMLATEDLVKAVCPH